MNLQEVKILVDDFSEPSIFKPQLDKSPSIHSYSYLANKENRKYRRKLKKLHKKMSQNGNSTSSIDRYDFMQAVEYCDNCGEMILKGRERYIVLGNVLYSTCSIDCAYELKNKKEGK